MIPAAITQSPAATPEPSLIKDIAPPVDAFPYPLWMVIVAGLIAALFLAGLIWLVVRWLKRRPAPPAPSARQVALRELETLRAQVRSLEPYAFSIAVSDILRSYIGAEYRLHAREQTSPEFLASIAESVKFTDSDRTLLGEFLARCDLIKFARIDATGDDSAGLLESALRFVEGGRA